MSPLKLEDLLQFTQITIQCHDDPDADAIASGFAVLEYLKSQGKAPRLVYSGKDPISKADLLKMCELFQIHPEHVPDPQTEAPAELLVVVDGHPKFQTDKSKLTLLPFRNIAIIDHHAEPEMQAMLDGLRERCGPDGAILCEFRTSYGSCSTILWDMLCQANWADRISSDLATALYFGLYIDSSYFQRLTETDPKDTQMQDALSYDRGAFDQLKSSNLKLDELRIYGAALANLQCSQEYPFAVAETESCHPNLLGTISDMIIGVVNIDACVSYCKRSDHVKLSVRSIDPEIPADKLAAWIARGIGDGGGRNNTVAGGTLQLDKLEAVCENDFWLGRREAVGRLIHDRITSYYEMTIQQKASKNQPEEADGQNQEITLDALAQLAEQGDADALYQLGSRYARGEDVPQDWERAAACYTQAAERGHAAAQYSLGVCYAYGRGVPKNANTAAKWYLKAAEQEHPVAQKDLGVCFARGRGVRQDWAQAAIWYARSAENGDIHAQHNLAQRYARGEGVPQDFQQAAVWYRRAADQGYSWSQYKLGDCYAHGDGVKQDLEQAIHWYTLAAQQGVDEAQRKLDALLAQKPQK